MPAPAGKHLYTDDEKTLFRTDPEKFLDYRKAVDGVMQERFPIFLRHHPLHESAKPMMRELVTRQFGDREDLVRLFTPEFSPGCRRPTVGVTFSHAHARTTQS